MVAAEVMATEATHPALSSSNLLNDIQTNVLDSSHLGQKQITVSETILVYCYPHAPPEGTPFFESLQEREKTPCVQSLQEKEKTPCIKTVLPVGVGSGMFLASGKNGGPTGPYSVYSGTVTDCLSKNAQICPGCPASQSYKGLSKSCIPKTRQSLEANHRLKFTKQISGHTKIQDRVPRINTGKASGLPL